MRILAFSDVHRDESAAQDLVRRTSEVDVLVGAGDLATMRVGLDPIVEILAASSVPVVLVPGNGESQEELEAACAPHAHVHALHGTGITIGDLSFFGLGGAVPITPFGSWSYDFSEEEAGALLGDCPEEGVLVSHSPPRGSCDKDGEGRSLGSKAVHDVIVRCRPRQVICGHIHASWGCQAEVGPTRVLNAGPRGRLIEL